MSFALEIKRLRKALGLSQQQLADKIGKGQSTIGNLESGRNTDVTTATLYALSDALGVSCDHWRAFLTAEPEPPKPKKKGR